MHTLSAAYFYSFTVHANDPAVCDKYYLKKCSVTVN